MHRFSLIQTGLKVNIQVQFMHSPPLTFDQISLRKLQIDQYFCNLLLPYVWLDNWPFFLVEFIQTTVTLMPVTSVCKLLTTNCKTEVLNQCKKKKKKVLSLDNINLYQHAAGWNMHMDRILSVIMFWLTKINVCLPTSSLLFRLITVIHPLSMQKDSNR